MTDEKTEKNEEMKEKKETGNAVPAKEGDGGTKDSEPQTEKKSADRKPAKKKLGKILAVTAGILLILFIIVSISLGSIIKAAVNNVLPSITGTPCSMDSCSLNMLTGTLNIKNFVIGNPEGYETEHAFKLKEINVDLAVTTLLSKKIQIEDITVDNMVVSYEMKLGETNIGRIMDNINELAESDKEEKAEEAEGKEAPPESEKQPGTTKGIQIDHFKFVNSKIIIHAGAGVPVPLPAVEVNDIGKDSENGANAVEVSNKIFSALYDSIVEAVKNIDISSEDIKKGSDKVMNTVKGWFGGDDDKK